MSVMDTLIVDRTAEDVERIRELRNKILTEGLDSLTQEEKDEYQSDHKGAYNISDLNRVSDAGTYILTVMDTFYTQYMSYLSARSLGGDPIYDPYFDPNYLTYTFPTFSGLAYIPQATIAQWLAGLVLVRSVSVNPDDLPTLPDITGLAHADYSTANDIERLLSGSWEAFQQYMINQYNLADRGYASIPYSDEFDAGEY